MKNVWLGLRRVLRDNRRPHRPRAFRPGLLPLEDRCVPVAGVFVQTNLVSDISGLAANTDPNLVNPWGLTAGPTTPFWVSDQAAGVSTLYNGQGVAQPPPPSGPLVVKIPPHTGAAPGTKGLPTGTVFNTAKSDFTVSEVVGGVTKSGSSVFLFDTLDGVIAGWNPTVDRNNAIVGVSTPGASYTGLAFDTDTIGRNLLYAADFGKGTIDVFDSTFKPTTVPGGFSDSKIPSNYAPFNVQNLGGLLYVAYAKVDPTTHRDQPGAGHGFVDVFNSDGVLQKRLVRHGALDSPWGLAIAPANFGAFSNDVLVGNFGDGHINAYNPRNGHFVGTLTLASGKPFVEDHLWALRFGNGVTADTNTLYFTAGIQNETHGLFGSIQAVSPIAHNAAIVTALAKTTPQIFSTVPPNGDVNPYGVAFVPSNFKDQGLLHAGDVLVSNFNNKDNKQGTGSTIVRISPTGEHSVFFQGESELGLTTALGVLKSGFVIVGSVPTTDGTFGTIQQGSLLILDNSGTVVTTLTDSKLLDGPWDLAINDEGGSAQVFVSNVRSGTVTRIDLQLPAHGNPVVKSMTQIASGYASHSDPTALIVGPTGLAYDAKKDVLYVASTADNAVYAIAHAEDTKTDAGKGKLVYKDDAHLRGPLGLVLAPNGDLIAANGDAVNGDPNQPSELVEFTPKGKFVDQFSIDPAQGAAFGIAVDSSKGALRFAAVNDNTNTLEVWTFATKKGSDED
jgi:uncharacterized protein (TIGR03118 family)